MDTNHEENFVGMESYKFDEKLDQDIVLLRNRAISIFGKIFSKDCRAAFESMD